MKIESIAMTHQEARLLIDKAEEFTDVARAILAGRSVKHDPMIIESAIISMCVAALVAGNNAETQEPDQAKVKPEPFRMVIRRIEGAAGGVGQLIGQMSPPLSLLALEALSNALL